MIRSQRSRLANLSLKIEHILEHIRNLNWITQKQEFPRVISFLTLRSFTIFDQKLKLTPIASVLLQSWGLFNLSQLSKMSSFSFLSSKHATSVSDPSSALSSIILCSSKTFSQILHSVSSGKDKTVALICFSFDFLIMI